MPVFTGTKNVAKQIFLELGGGKAELKTVIEYTLLNFAILGKEKKSYRYDIFPWRIAMTCHREA